MTLRALPWRQAAVALIAAAGLLLGAGRAVAQGNGYTPVEEDQVLLQLQVKNRRMVNEIRGYQTPEGICVDLADVIQSLDMPIRLDKKSRRATGWIFAEDQAFSIDRDSNRVQIVNNERLLQPGELYDSPEGWCVDTDALGGWFGVTFQANVRASVLVLDSERPLPFIEQLERESRAARLRPERDPRDLSAYPHAAQPYALWRMPSIDVVARTDYRAGHGRGRANVNYEVFASGEIAMASYDLRLASDSNGMPASLRLRAFRMDPQAGLLGPLKASQIMAGDVDMPSGNLAGASGVGRGVFLSNRPLSRPTRFGTTVVRGTLPLGWDAELYRNGQLLAYQGSNADGRYEFEIGLLFGRNDIEVKLYGPQGQVRSETQSIPVGQGAVAPGHLEYWAGIIQRNRDLIHFGRGPPGGAADRGWHYAIGAQYGLDRRTVVGASGHSLTLEGARHDYAELSVQRALGPMLLNLTAAQDVSRGRAYHAEMLGQIGNINVHAESFLTDGPFVSGLIGPNEKSSHRLEIDTVTKLGRMPVPLAAGLRRTTRRDGREVNEYLMRGSLILPRGSLTGFVVRRQVSGGYDEDEGMLVGALANTRLLGLSLRGEAQYRLNGARRGFDSARMTIEKALSDRSDLRIDIEHSARTGLTELEAGYVRHFRKLSLLAGARIDNRGALGANLAVNFSLGPDPLGGGWRMSREKLAERGAAAVSVFLDADGDGRRSPDEEPLTGVNVTAGQFGSSEPTNDDGHAIVEGLPPFESVLISIDESSLPDPFLMSRGGGIVVTPRPGVPAVIELAVAPTGEVEGLLTSPEGTPLGGAKLELLDARGQVVSRTMSEYDGFFLFERIPYGRYQLQLADETRAVLGVGAALADAIELGPDHTLDRVGTIRLQGATTVAQARDPPLAEP